MSSEPFVSFAPNREDVVLHRALRDVVDGRFLDIGIRGPVESSIGHAFSRLGWAGRSISAGQPVDDVPVPPDELHFVVVDGAPAERIAALGRLLPDSIRPWILVLRHTSTSGPTPTDLADLEAFSAQGYDLCLNDGLSLFLVDRSRDDQLRSRLSVPANILDEVIYERDRLRDGLLVDLTERNEALAARMAQNDAANLAAVLDWRRFAVDAWSRGATSERTEEIHTLRKQIELNFNHIRVVDGEIDRLRAELDAFHHTFSWRVTRPLRRVRGITRRSRS